MKKFISPHLSRAREFGVKEGSNAKKRAAMGPFKSAVPGIRKTAGQATPGSPALRAMAFKVSATLTWSALDLASMNFARLRGITLSSYAPS